MWDKARGDENASNHAYRTLLKFWAIRLERFWGVSAMDECCRFAGLSVLAAWVHAIGWWFCRMTSCLPLCGVFPWRSDHHTFVFSVICAGVGCAALTTPPRPAIA